MAEPYPLRMAQLSFWFSHADHVCLAAQETPGVELAAVWDSVEARGEARADLLGVPFVGDLEALLARDDVDAVACCAEPALQPSLVEAAAAAGMHVLVEKPIAADLEGAARIVRAAEQHGVVVMPAYNLRLNPVAAHVKQLVDSGALGSIARVRRLHGHSHSYEAGEFDAHRIAEQRGWGDPVEELRDSLFFAGSHSALWFQWMFGSPTFAYCATTTVTAHLPVEDNAVTVLEYPDGLLATMETSETLLAQGTVAEIYGTDAVVLQLRGNLPSTRVWNAAYTPLQVFWRETETWEAPQLPPEFLRHEPQYSSVRTFFEVVQGRRPQPTSVYDGFDSIAILVAAAQASKERRAVPVRRWGDYEDLL